MSAKQTKGAWGWHGEAVTEGLYGIDKGTIPQSACSADSPLYTRGPFCGGTKAPPYNIINLSAFNFLSVW